MFFVVLKLFLGLKERLVNTIHECLSLNFSEIISINMKEARKLRTKSLRKSPRTCVSIKFDLKRLCQSICKGIFCGFWNTSVYSSENLTAFSTNNLKIDGDNFCSHTNISNWSWRLQSRLKQSCWSTICIGKFDSVRFILDKFNCLREV